MTPQQLKAMKLALEAMKYADACLKKQLTTKVKQEYAQDLLFEAGTAIKEALAQPKQEPLEYWNAVEGWVKIDEVREHFETVGCATIYKTAGEGRVPLSLAKAQPEQEPVAWPCLIDSADFSENTITLVMQCEDYKVSAGTHWLSTTPPKETT